MTRFDLAHERDHFTISESLVELSKRAIRLCDVQIDSALEVGCGQGTNLAELFNKDIFCLGIDISPRAISKALQKGYSCHFQELDSLSINSLKRMFSFVLDSHHIHYLSSRGDIETYLKEVYQCLMPGGALCFEAMINHKKMLTHSDCMILSSFDYEEILSSVGFKIVYLMIPRGRKFIASATRNEALESDPDVLQIIAIKS